MGGTLPPGSFGLPLIGETWPFLRDPRFIQKRVARYGPVFKTHLLGAPTVIFSSPQAAQLVLASAADHFSWAEGFPRAVRRLLDGSLILQDGAAARQLRRLLTPAFHQRALALYRATIEAAAERHLDRWLAQGEIAWFAAFKELTFEIISRVLLGGASDAETARLSRLFNDFSGGLLAPLPARIPGTAFDRAWRARARLRAFIGERLADRQRAPGDDMISLLLHADGPAGERLAPAQIIDQMVLLLFAGHDTTSALLTSVCCELALHPAALARARAEQAGLDAAPLRDQLERMPYLDAVIRETERLHPPAAGSFRGVLKPVSIDGLLVPAGWRVYYSIYGVHRTAPGYADPERFDPDRFGPGRAEHRSHAFSLIGFGGGPRTCLGMLFAQLTMKIVLARLLRCCQWDLLPGQDLSFQLYPLGRPRDGLRVYVRRHWPQAGRAAALGTGAG